MNCVEKNIRANNLLQFIHQVTFYEAKGVGLAWARNSGLSGPLGLLPDIFLKFVT